MNRDVKTGESAKNLATGEGHAVCRCDRCGAEIAFVRSKKSGKWYPADVVHTPSESAHRLYNLRVAPWQPHFKTCEETQARRLKERAEARRDAACAELLNSEEFKRAIEAGERETYGRIAKIAKQIADGEVMV